jgi:hypothetical protein
MGGDLFRSGGPEASGLFERVEVREVGRVRTSRWTMENQISTDLRESWQSNSPSTRTSHRPDPLAAFVPNTEGQNDVV